MSKGRRLERIPEKYDATEVTPHSEKGLGERISMDIEVHGTFQFRGGPGNRLAKRLVWLSVVITLVIVGAVLGYFLFANDDSLLGLLLDLLIGIIG